MKNGKNKGLTKGNKTKGLTAQARLEGENLKKFEYLKQLTGLNNSSVLISAISEFAIIKGYQIN
jgi:hypothetical protein